MIASRSKCALGSINNILLKKFRPAQEDDPRAKRIPDDGLRGISIQSSFSAAVHFPIPHAVHGDRLLPVLPGKRSLIWQCLCAFFGHDAIQTDPLDSASVAVFCHGLRNSCSSRVYGKGFLVFIFRRRTFNCNGCAPTLPTSKINIKNSLNWQIFLRSRNRD